MDFVISGISKINLEEIVNKISLFNHLIKKFIIWDKNGKIINESMFEEGTSFLDSIGILEFNFELIKRISFLLNPKIGTNSTTIEVSFHRYENHSIVDGQLFIDHILDNYQNDEDLIYDLANFLIKISNALSIVFINVSDEDDESLIVNETGLFFPSVFGIYHKNSIKGEMDILTETSCSKIISLNKDNNYKLIIVQPEFKHLTNSDLVKHTFSFITNKSMYLSNLKD